MMPQPNLSAPDKLHSILCKPKRNEKVRAGWAVGRIAPEWRSQPTLNKNDSILQNCNNLFNIFSMLFWMIWYVIWTNNHLEVLGEVVEMSENVWIETVTATAIDTNISKQTVGGSHKPHVRGTRRYSIQAIWSMGSNHFKWNTYSKYRSSSKPGGGSLH